MPRISDRVADFVISTRDSIRSNDQWRICFRWADGDAHDVRIVDYH